MKREKMIKLDSTANKKSTTKISEVYALLDVIKSIKMKEMEEKKGRKLSTTSGS